MFSWIPIHEEAASKIVDLPQGQQGLLETLMAMRDAGLTVVALTDKGSQGRKVPLSEIDPFSFLASFNRGITDANRQANWSFLKDRWRLRSKVPADFDGIPIVHNMKSWFFPYARKRDPGQIKLLWHLFQAAVEEPIDGIPSDLFDRCAQLDVITIKKLTIGLFWARPSVFLPADSKTQDFARHKGVESVPESYESYRHWVHEVTSRVGTNFPAISRDAHVWSMNGKPKDERTKRYWVIAPGNNGSEWEEFFDEGIVAIDWNGMNDLKTFATRDDMRVKLQELYPSDTAKTNDSLACWQFANDIRPGDVVFAKNGIQRILGSGTVLGDYEFDAERDSFRHVRDVEWAAKGDWELPNGRKLPLKTLTDITDDHELVTVLLGLIGIGKGLTPDPPTAAHNFWWLNANPKIWSLEEAELGAVQTYSTHNEKGNKRQRYKWFQQAAPGDLVVGYATSPDAKVVAICEITKGIHEASNGESIEFKKIEHLDQPVLLEELKRLTALVEAEPMLQNQGSLFRLTSSEFDAIRTLIDERIPEVAEPWPPYSRTEGLKGLFMSPKEFDSLVESLELKKNLVLQGAPGVGKTHVAKKVAFTLIGSEDPERVQMVQFHQSYSYEDFVQGFRPTAQKGFELKNGIFHQFCRKAQQTERDGKKYVFIIDEINRGNLSRIFGELMMLIESDKRGSQYRLPLTYSPLEEFYVPSNVYLLGLMNTADRSLSMVDYALRRRFRFVTLEPQFESSAFRQHLISRDASEAMVAKIVKRLVELNLRIASDKRNLGPGYRVGHSFFCPRDGQVLDEEWYRGIVEGEVLPLLREYWLDEEKTIDECEALLLA